MKMNEQQIQGIFNTLFKYPNPIYKYPIRYFQHNDYICEIAVADKPSSLDWRRVEKNPLNIFDGLFVSDKYWITVLKLSKDGTPERTNLSDCIDSLEQLDSFIENNLN